MSREFLLLVQESAYKTPATAVVWPTGSATAFYIRMDGSNAFTMRPRPVMVTVPYGGGLAVDAFRVADKFRVQGQADYQALRGTALGVPPGLGGEADQYGPDQPWTTTEIAGDLASVAIYHGIARSDGTIKRRVYLGCKVDSWDLDVSENSTIATLSLDITGSTPQGNQFDASNDPNSSVFPAPTDRANADHGHDRPLRVHTRVGRPVDRHRPDAVFLGQDREQERAGQAILGEPVPRPAALGRAVDHAGCGQLLRSDARRPDLVRGNRGSHRGRRLHRDRCVVHAQ